MITRTRYQKGSLTRKNRADGTIVWEFRFYEMDGNGKRRRRSVTVGTLADYPTETAARRSSRVQSILLGVNSEQSRTTIRVPSFGEVLSRYEQEEMPERYSTQAAYRAHIKNHIRPK